MADSIHISNTLSEPYDTVRLYVGFYGRPPDAAGLNFWSGVSKDIFYNTIGRDPSPEYTKMYTAFATSAEAQRSVYTDANGNPLSHSALVGRVYNNLFSREPDAAGLQFYTNALDTGAMSLVGIVKNVIDGAQNEDRTTLHVKTAVSLAIESAFAKHPDVPYDEQAVSDARVVLSHVTGGDVTIQQMKTAADYLLYDTAVRYHVDVPKPDAPRPFVDTVALAREADAAPSHADDAAATASSDDQATPVDVVGVTPDGHAADPMLA